MITLQQAIELATKAHEGQWRNPIPINFSETKIEGYDFNFIVDNYVKGLINKEGNLIEYKFNTIFLSKPYITHPLAVMDMMHTEEEKIVAVLHDVIEDCDGYGLGRAMDNSSFWITIQHTSEKFYISYNIYCALSLLTHEKDISYIEYITVLVNGNVRYDILNKEAAKLAIKIKLADIVHNLSENPSEHAKQKYLKAMHILLQNI